MLLVSSRELGASTDGPNMADTLKEPQEENVKGRNDRNHINTTVNAETLC